MDFNVEYTYVVNRTAGISTSLLVTLKAYDMEQVPDKTITAKMDAEGTTEDFVGPDYAAATVLGTRAFTYIIPEDQQTDKEHSDSHPHNHDNETEYQEKKGMWEETFGAGQDYMTCHSHLESEIL